MSNRSNTDKARVHATRVHHCSCGKFVFGNGGKYVHAQMHERRGDGHHGLTSCAWNKQFGQEYEAVRTVAYWLYRMGQ